MKPKWEEELEKRLLENFWYEVKLRCVISGIFLLIAISFLIFLGIEAAGVVFFLVAIVFFVCFACRFCLMLLPRGGIALKWRLVRSCDTRSRDSVMYVPVFIPW